LKLNLKADLTKLETPAMENWS